jgi:hypothetical protein
MSGTLQNNSHHINIQNNEPNIQNQNEFSCLRKFFITYFSIITLIECILIRQISHTVNDIWNDNSLVIMLHNNLYLILANETLNIYFGTLYIKSLILEDKKFPKEYIATSLVSLTGAIMYDSDVIYDTSSFIIFILINLAAIIISTIFFSNAYKKREERILDVY